MGVGGHQAGRDILGSRLSVGCMLHGLNNILEALAAEDDDIGETMKKLYACNKKLRTDSRHILRDNHVSIPPNHNDIRWDRFRPVFDFHFTHYGMIAEDAPSAKMEMSEIDRLSDLATLMQPLS